MVGLYLHVPLCRRKCHYCDFASRATSPGLVNSYLTAIEHEIAWVSEHAPDAIHPETVYLGGGTPSVLPDEYFDRLIRAVRAAFPLDPGIEWTIEANPESLDRDRLARWRRHGANRVSLGVQSFQDRLLGELGRLHTATRARQAISWIREAGFDRWSIDLMCGLPGQDLTLWQTDLAGSLKLRPPHLSIYPLTLEPGTEMFERSRRGELTLPDDDLVADMLARAEETLEAAGFEHYEIASYCLPGEACRHNRGYWLRTPYLGLGPAAASFFGGVRSRACDDLEHYAACWSNPHAAENRGDPFVRPTSTEVEILDEADACRESILLGTRLLAGFDLRPWRAQFGPDLTAPLEPVIEQHRRSGLLEQIDSVIRLSRSGRWIANAFWQDLLA